MDVMISNSRSWLRRISSAAALGLVAGLLSSLPSAAADLPQVDPSVAIVTSGPLSAEGRYRIVITVSEIYHHVFAQWLTYGPEGSGAKVSSQYAIEDDQLGGWKYSIKMISNIEWHGDDELRLRINDRKNCAIKLSRESYAATCE